VGPRGLGAGDAAAGAALDGAAPRGAARAAAAAAGRAAAQRRQLARLRREARAPIRTLPFVFAERLGAAHVDAFADRLRRAH
jgi:hypothetical protein